MLVNKCTMDGYKPQLAVSNTVTDSNDKTTATS